MQKELHIWMGDNIPDNLCVTLHSTLFALNNNCKMINTTQSHVCSTTWLTKGYRMFVHMIDDEEVEIKLGHINNCDREIRLSHNLERLLLANCFGRAVEDYSKK